MQGLGRHSVYTLSDAQPEVVVRLLVARLDARSTSIKQSEASFKYGSIPTIGSSALIFLQQYSTIRKRGFCSRFDYNLPGFHSSSAPITTYSLRKSRRSLSPTATSLPSRSHSRTQDPRPTAASPSDNENPRPVTTNLFRSSSTVTTGK